jgi:hypothetical protein
MGWVDVYHHILPAPIVGEDPLDVRAAGQRAATPGRGDRMDVHDRAAPIELLEQGLEPRVSQVVPVVIGEQANATRPQLVERIGELGEPGVEVRSGRAANTPNRPERLVAFAQMTGSVPDALERLASRLYVDALTTTGPGAFIASSELFAPGRVLFGSDYPYVPIEATAGGLRALGLDGGVLDRIAAGNARSSLAR